MNKNLDLTIQAGAAQRQGMGYALVNSDLVVLRANEMIKYWMSHAPAPSKMSEFSVVEQSLHYLFPELIGVEEALQEMAHTQQGNLTIPQIYRPIRVDDVAANTLGYYFDLHIEPLHEPDRLLVITVDVTRQAHLQQRLQQERNELRLNARKQQQLKLAYEEVRDELEQRVQEKTAALVRTNTLITALSQVAIKIETTPTPEAVMETLGRELKKLDVTSFIAILDDELEALILHYSSIELKMLTLAQKLSGLTLQGFRLTPDNFPLYTTLIDDKQTSFTTDLALLVQTATLDNMPAWLVKRVLQLVGINPDTSAIYLPLLVEGQVLGVLGMWGQSLQENDVKIFTVFASQVAIALRNAQLFQAAQLEAKNLATVLDASKVISSSLDLETVLQRISEQLVKAMNVAGCVISRWDPETDAIIIWTNWHTIKAKGFDDVGSIYYLKDYPNTRHVLETRQSLNILGSDPKTTPAQVAIMKERNAQSVLILPLAIGKRVVGLLEIIETRYERKFTAAETELCQALISQAAVAIENAQLLSTTEQQLNYQLTLQAAAKLVTSTLELSTILKRLSEFLATTINATSAYICSYEPDKGTATVLAEYFGPHASPAEQISDLDKSYDLADIYPANISTLRAGKPVTLNAADESLIDFERRHSQLYKVKTILAIPLIVRSQLVAFVELWESRHPRTFTPAEIELSQAIAQHAAVAIENARLFESVRESETRYRLVAELTSDFAYAVHLAVDGSLFVAWMTDAFQSITGFTVAEVTADSNDWLRIIYPEDIPIVEKQNQCILQGHPDASEFRIITKEGRQRWLRNHVRPEWDSLQNRVIGYYGAAQDITAGKQAEEKLRQYAANIKALHNIDRAILESESSAEIAHSALTYVRVLVPYSRASVVLFHPETDEASVLAVNANDGPQLKAGQRQPLSNFDLAGLQQGEHKLITDLSTHTNPSVIDEQLLTEGIATYMMLPLIYRNELIGCFNLGADHSHAFSAEHIDIAHGIANQLSIAIQNRRLFEQVQQYAETLEQQVAERTTQLQLANEGLQREIAERRRAETALRDSEERLRSTIASMDELIFILDKNGVFLDYYQPVNKAELYIPPETFIGKSFKEVLPLHMVTALEQAINAAISSGIVQQFDYALEIADNLLWFSANVSVRTDGKGDFAGVTVVARNITKRKQAEEALQTSEEQYRNLVETMNEGLVIFNIIDRITYVNNRYCHMFGYTREELVGYPITRILDVTNRQVFNKQISKLKRKEQNPYELVVTHKTGRAVFTLISPRPLFDEQKQYQGGFAVITDITDRKKAEQILYHAAFHDALTDLPNRDLLKRHLQQALERAKKQADYCFALLFIDLDRFKIINDSLGHLAGDQMLVTISRRIEACLRNGDLVARLGGDEFAVLLKNLEAESQVYQITEQILKEISKPIEIKGEAVFTTASIGITINNIAAYEQPEELLRDADASMYQAKFLGKARYVVFETDMHARAMAKLTLETELRLAVEQKLFELYYQPIVSVPTGQIVGVEALLRWTHPQHGLMPAARFLPLLEETGLIMLLGRWVMRTACRQARQWHITGHDTLRIAVNVSVYQLQQPDFIEMIQSVLKETHLTPHLLELEITESTSFKNVEISGQILETIKELGVQISIDDFGTGYSSLSHLRHLPGDSLKIDQTFIKSIPNNPNDEAIVSAMIAMGHRLGMKIICEGVETREQLTFLQSRQCDEAQGYLFAQPMPAKALTQLLSTGKYLMP